MALLKRFIFVLAVVLITSILWVGTVLYINFSSVQLRGELMGSKNVYEFLGKGMLEEVKIVVEEDENLPDEVSSDLLEPIEPYFSKVAFEKIVKKIEENLIVSPEEFHQLQNDAVIRSEEKED